MTAERIPKRILIVDDIDANLYLLRALLTGSGYAVMEATNGAEALELARSEPPDLMITDLLMPVMDGFTLCTTWRGEPALVNIPIIVYTATYTDPRDEEVARSAGADVFLVKPAEPERLLHIIGDVLRRHAAGTLGTHPGGAVAADQFLRLYNSALIRKLEDKLEQLHDSNVRLTEAETFLRAVIDSLPAHVLVFAANGEIVSVNQPHADYKGQGASQIWLAHLQTGANFPALCREVLDVSRADVQRLIKGVEDLLAGRVAQLNEEFSVHADGMARWFAVTARSLATRPGHVVMTHVDVTDRRALEMQILRVAHQEQRHLGMDLHDGLGQEMTGIALMLGGLARQVADGDATLHAELTRLAALASRSVATARSIARGLYPVSVQDGSISSALQQLAASTRELFGIDASVEVVDSTEPEMAQHTAYHLYRIAQEAISNAVRHGKASKVSIQIESIASQLCLRVVNNGAQLPVVAARQGSGLSIMHYRARAIGGSFAIHNLPEGGVEALCHWSASESSLRAPGATSMLS
jgi:signal transduction histidine kinase/DNA-binding response OmpR family regulator